MTPGDTVTLGLALVPLLVEQVHGILTITREQGNSFQVLFRRNGPARPKLKKTE